MKSFLIFLTLLSGSSVLLAQNNTLSLVDSTTWNGGAVYLTGHAGVAGTSLQKDVFGKLLYGGYIDSEMKDRSFEKHNLVNRFGVMVQNDLVYFNATKKLAGSDQLNWGVKCSYNMVGALTYSDDLFGGIFYGNQNYAGDTIFFSNNRGKYTQYQSLGLGVQSKKTGSYLFVNAVNVENYMDVSFRKSYIAQNDDVSQIDALLRGTVRYTQGEQFNKGLGVSIDGAYVMRVQWLKDKKALFEASVHGIGVAKVNNLIQFEADSMYSYTGFTFNQLTSDASPFKRDDFDVLDSLGIQRDTVSSWIILPGYFQLSKQVDVLSDLKVQSFFGVRIYPSLNINPAAYAGVYYRPMKAFSVSANIGVGGLAKYRYGLALGYHSNAINVIVATDDADGFVSGKAFGQSIILKTIWKI